MLGPLAYNLSFRNSVLVILFFNLLVTIAPGIMATFGPKTGMRQMIHARYSFGYVCYVSVLTPLVPLLLPFGSHYPSQSAFVKVPS